MIKQTSGNEKCPFCNVSFKRGEAIVGIDMDKKSLIGREGRTKTIVIWFHKICLADFEKTDKHLKYLGSGAWAIE